MGHKPRVKLKSYRFLNFAMDFYFAILLGLLVIVGSILFYTGCVSVKEYFGDELKENWELILLPIGIVWLYFNLRGLYYIIYMMLKKPQKEIVNVEKIIEERIKTVRGKYRVWKAYYKDGVFELNESQAKKIEQGQKVELWFKPERKGNRRRNVAVYV